LRAERSNLIGGTVPRGTRDCRPFVTPDSDPGSSLDSRVRGNDGGRNALTTGDYFVVLFLAIVELRMAQRRSMITTVSRRKKGQQRPNEANKKKSPTYGVELGHAVRRSGSQKSTVVKLKNRSYRLPI